MEVNDGERALHSTIITTLSIVCGAVGIGHTYTVHMYQDVFHILSSVPRCAQGKK